MTLAHDVGFTECIGGKCATEKSSLRLLAVDVTVAFVFVIALLIPPVNAAKVLAMFVDPVNEGNFSMECREVKLASLGVLLKE